MSEYKNGDTVRVVLEGKVKDLDTFGFDVLTSDGLGLFVAPRYETVKSVEVLLKVGDTVRHTQYDLLPVGTVVQGMHSTLWKLSDGSWAGVDGTNHLAHRLLAARTIKYLPE